MDTTTIVAALTHSLTGSTVAVGAAAAIARYGWLFPQLFVGYLAQKREQRLPFYMVGAFGRAACLVAVAAVIFGADSHSTVSIVLFFSLWTLYAFVSGIVAVPYNDIVARSIPSEYRSRLLAVRFFGGGILALVVAGAAYQILAALGFPGGYATVFLLGASLLLISASSFVSAGEPPASLAPFASRSFRQFLRRGVDVFLFDRSFRLFLGVQWLGGMVAMSFPFYVLQATSQGISAADVALLLGAQTAGAFASNPLWGWWGDHRGKASLLGFVAMLGILPPLLTLVWMAVGGSWVWMLVPWFLLVFSLLGALNNGRTIAQLGYLMEISPDDQRPAYSGYFNALAAPAALFPLAGAVIAEKASFGALFAASMSAAVLQFLIVRYLGTTRKALPPVTAFSWLLARLRYWRHGIRLSGRPEDEVWYFAFGANMHDSAFRERRGMRPLEWRPGRVRGYRLRFNLEGRPKGRAAPANLSVDPQAEVWGVLYHITRADLLRLDSTEGVPGRRYRHLWVDAEDVEGHFVRAVTYVADGKEVDGNPSLRYLTLLREGARAHGLPDPYLRFLDEIKPAE